MHIGFLLFWYYAALQQQCEHVDHLIPLSRPKEVSLMSNSWISMLKNELQDSLLESHGLYLPIFFTVRLILNRCYVIRI
ncbi:hypothetical protein A4A49_55648 [Nicotiana attenuata]|uniref:Uncharacterized protein n=1 Tax=Nicotiana attenuata TaxID=49451 RepID=A0A314KRA4_NICAT|nr:hypothetical protein A4A49_55648 [Nicotiana attenuata]